MSSTPQEGGRVVNGAPLLEVRDLVVHHGQLRALSAVARMAPRWLRARRRIQRTRAIDGRELTRLTREWER